MGETCSTYAHSPIHWETTAHKKEMPKCHTGGFLEPQCSLPALVCQEAPGPLMLRHPLWRPYLLSGQRMDPLLIARSRDLRNSHGSTGSSTSNQDCGYYQREKSRRHSASIRAELLKTKPENNVCISNISISQQGVAGCFLQARCLLIRLADLLPAHWTIYLQFPRTLCIFSLSIALRTELSYCICTHLRFQPTSRLQGAFTQIQFNLFHRP